MKTILDKVGLIPVPFAMAACMLATAMVAGCTADTYAGGGVLQINDGCHARQQFNAGHVQQFVQPQVVYRQQFVAPVYAQQFVQPVYGHRQQAVFIPVQQFNGHHVQQFNGGRRRQPAVQFNFGGRNRR
jgi:hypothetical protein